MKQIELILTDFFSFRKKLERGSPLFAIRYNSKMIFGERMVHRGHRLDRKALVFSLRKRLECYPPIRYSPFANRYSSKMIFTDFFSCRKSWNAEAPYSLIAIRYSLLFERRIL